MKDKLSLLFSAISLAVAAPAAMADVVAHFPMDVRSGQIVESVSGNRFAVGGHFAPENVPGAVGQALRFDGYTSYVDARLGKIIPEGSKTMTVSLWAAVESYPIIEVDKFTDERTAIVSCLDDNAKTGFGFFLGFDGRYSFKAYIGGWPLEVVVETPMPTYTWNFLAAVVDCENRSVKIYNNGKEVGSSRCTGSLALGDCPFYMGQSPVERFMGPFELMSFNGLIDDIEISNEALDAAALTRKAENEANLDIPTSRFADDILRPRFHGMPAAAWTNECHGMTYANGRYHLFFQKNADGPYMARLHWGHISSENLYDWEEEKIAIAPGASYDIKGCWSGCVFTDDAITGGRPNILYTAVDYARATIAQAMPTGSSLENWAKSASNPIIGGRPSGLSDDFRDPYFFRNGDNAYIIVGSSKDGVGTTTLHRYNASNKTWSNDGDLFFTGSSRAVAGRFWEMPTVTPMGNDRWLFTATPLETSTGVRTLYWTGTIGSDGKFTPASGFATPKQVELVSRDGFGLLSPTIYQHEGKTIALGIVPDKLSGQDNWNLGWAHCYSLPREWWLDEKGNLLQKPFEGLTGLRSTTMFEKADFELDGALDLTPVDGREMELLGVFEVGSSPVGFRIFKTGNNTGTITYNPSTGELVADFTRVRRLVNDNGVYNGVYRASLPERLAAGSELKMNVFVDHSIVDIFINDRWATSIRVFPTEADASVVEAISTNGATKVKSLQGWVSKTRSFSSIGNVAVDSAEPAEVDVYDLSGRCVRRGVAADTATTGLPSGFYVAGGKKIFVR